MRFLQIGKKLYLEPWSIDPRVHRLLCGIYEAHVTGEAHQPGGSASAFLIEEKKEDEGQPFMAGDINVIPIHGVISRKVSGIMKSSGMCDVQLLETFVADAVADDNVKGILLDIDSPGGLVVGVREAAQVIASACETKPVVAFTDGDMCSAAYWLGCGADAIYATGAAETGSIGIYLAFLDSSRRDEMQGLKLELFKTGKYKGMGLRGLALTDEQRAFLEADVQQVYSWFKDAVNLKRNIPASAMEGQCFYSEDALEVGLIDRIGSLDDAMQEVHDLADLRCST
jgi:signal peptide peptidase SppA